MANEPLKPVCFKNAIERYKRLRMFPKIHTSPDGVLYEYINYQRYDSGKHEATFKVNDDICVITRDQNSLKYVPDTSLTRYIDWDPIKGFCYKE
ncbi:MAG: hypothetical protein [Caudoviricetes sp.]|nr:MAG: hypothetical protein [Caudoviricetes sp.]